MSISYSQKQNERLIGQSIVSEPHTIGITGVAVVTPGLIRLVEVPQAPSPLSTVSIPGYTEITVGSPSGTQFLVNYTTGVITFNVSQDGNSILVSYIGLGSEIAAEDINELQGPVGVALNYNGSLTNNIVKPASISNTGTDDFTFPNNVIVSNNVTISGTTASTVPYLSAGKVITSSAVTPTQLSYLDATSSIQTQLNGKQASGSYITALTSDVSASGPGSATSTVNSVGGSSAANIHSAELAANAATNLDTVSTIVKRDGSGNFSAGTITASLTGHASLDLPLTGGTLSGALDLGTHQIHNVTDPSSAQDAATKNYVDGKIPSQVATVDLINVAADVTSALVTPTVSGMFLVSVYAVCTVSGSGGDVAPNLLISWTDQSGFNQNFFATPLGFSATLINYGSFPVFDTATNPISYNLTGGTYSSSLRYDISFRIEKI